MTQEEHLILDILQWLVRAGATRSAPLSLQSKEQTVRTFITASYPCSTIEDVEALKLRVEKGEVTLDVIGDRCAYFILPPVDQNGGFIPLINIDYNTSSGHPELRVRVGFFMFNQLQGNKPSSIGFRCEPPEGEGPGHHDYYHAQLLHQLDRNRDHLPLTWPTYVPTSQPAFPLHADGPLTLLFSALMAIYGKRFLRNEFIRDFRSSTFLMARMREWPPIAN